LYCSVARTKILSKRKEEDEKRRRRRFNAFLPSTPEENHLNNPTVKNERRSVVGKENERQQEKEREE